MTIEGERVSHGLGFINLSRPGDKLWLCLVLHAVRSVPYFARASIGVTARTVDLLVLFWGSRDDMRVQ